MVKTSIRTITPSQAQKMLDDGNSGNRNPSQAHIRSLASQMANDQWVLNGESIKLNGDGTLIDGQHRLMASVRSNKSFKTIVVEGLPKDTQMTVDVGRSRTFSDTMRIQRSIVKHNAAISGAVRATIAFEKSDGTSTRNVVDLFGSRKPSFAEMLAWFDAHQKDFSEIGSMHDRLKNELPLVVAATGIVSLGARRAGYGVQANEFFDVVRYGGQPRDNPATLLRERILKSNSRTARISRDLQVRLAVTAWNSWIQNAPMGVLRYTKKIGTPVVMLGPDGGPIAPIAAVVEADAA